MNRATLFFILISFYLYSADDSVFVEDPLPFGEASVNSLDTILGEPSSVVNQVDLYSGDYVDMQCDLTIPGADPLTFERFFNSSDDYVSNPLKAWKSNHDIYTYHPEGEKSDFFLVDSYGSKMPFTMVNEDRKCRYYEVNSQIYNKRMTNTGGGNLKNRRGLRSKEDEILKTKDGAGGAYYFPKPNKKDKAYIHRRVKPNGNQVFYEYAKTGIPKIIRASWILFHV